MTAAAPPPDRPLDVWRRSGEPVRVLRPELLDPEPDEGDLVVTDPEPTTPSAEPSVPEYVGNDPSLELDPLRLADAVRGKRPADPADVARANLPSFGYSTGEPQPLSRPLGDELDPDVLARAVGRSRRF